MKVRIKVVKELIINEMYNDDGHSENRDNKDDNMEIMVVILIIFMMGK